MGATRYGRLVSDARPWLDYLTDLAAQRHPLDQPDGRRAFLRDMLEVAKAIPDAAARDQFADTIAHRARITEEVVRAEIRKAAVTRRVSVPATRWTSGASELKPAERDLLAALVLAPREAISALAQLEEADLDGLRSAAILRLARTLESEAGGPSALFSRLNEHEGQLITSLAARGDPRASVAECIRALQAVRLQRERADVQREIDRLQGMGAAAHASQIADLWQRKKNLLLRLEALHS